MHTKRKALLGGQQVDGYLLNDGTGDILAVLTDVQSMNDSISATVTPHSLNPDRKTPWRRAIVSGHSEADIIARYEKAQRNDVRATISRTDLEGHLLKDIDQ